MQPLCLLVDVPIVYMMESGLWLSCRGGVMQCVQGAVPGVDHLRIMPPVFEDLEKEEAEIGKLRVETQNVEIK